MHRRLHAFAFLCATLALPAGSAFAAQQEAAAGAAQSSSADSEASLLERLEDLGKQIQQARRQVREAFAQQPAKATSSMPSGADYHLTALRIAGRVEGETARLVADLSAVVDGDGPFSIPLNQFATLESFAPSDAIISSEEGYLWRVEGEGEHEVRIEFSVPLEVPQVGSRQLRMPVVSSLASPVSQLKLTVPGERIEARNGSGQQLRVVPDAQAWLIEWNGLPHEGVLRVEWQRHVEKPEPPRLQSETAWLVNVQSDHAAIEATVSLQSRGSEFDQFQIQLPRGAEGVEWEVAGERTTNLRPPENPGSGALLSVMLESSTTGPVQLQLRFEQPIDGAVGELTLGGLEIPGALNQGGYLLLRSAEELEIIPAVSDSVEEIPLTELPPKLKGGRGGLAFRYVRQPFGLSARVRTRRAPIAVEPFISLLLVRQGEGVQGMLHARWVVSVQHGPIEAIDFELAGWEAGIGAVRATLLETDNGLSEQLVDAQASGVDESGRMTVRLARPVQEPLVIELDAQQALRAGRGVTVALPLALGGAVGDSRVALFAGDGVRIRPHLEAMPEALPDYFPSAGALPVFPKESGVSGDPQILRVRDAERPLSLDLELLPALVQVGCRTRITLRPESALVEQQFSLTAQNAPLSELLVDVPFALISTPVFASAAPAATGEGPFQQLLIGQLRRVAVAIDPATNESVWRVGVSLGESRTGRFHWSLRYEIPLELEIAQGKVVAMPLILPVADTLTHHEVEIHADAAVQVTPEGTASWRVSDGQERRSELRLRSDERAFSIPLVVAARARFLSEPAVISKAWIRTSIEPSGLRRYEARYRLDTDETFVMVGLPQGALRPSVRVDGRAARFETVEDGAYRVYLSQTETDGGASRRARGRYVMVVEYSVSSSRRLSHWSNTLRLEAPWFADARWEDRWYWQVLVPRQQHLLTQSDSYYAELRWYWLGLGWGRRANRTTDELNRWVPSDVAAADFSVSTNVYLFSRVGADGGVAGMPGGGDAGRSPTLTLRTVTPAFLLLVGSGAVAVFGLLLVSWTAARRLPVGVGLVFAVMIAASLYPFPAVLLLQASVPGLVLVGVAALLRWNLWRRQQRGVLVSAERSSILTIPSTLAPQSPELAGSVGSTRTGSRSGVGGLQ